MASPRVRRWLFGIHLWTGLVLGLYFVVMGLTGSIIAFRHEFDAALSPALLKVEPQGEKLPLSRLVAAVEATETKRKAARVEIYADPARSYDVRLGGSPAKHVYVDPYTARVLGSRDPEDSFVGTVYRLHRQLLFGKTGHTVSAYAALVVVWILITGIWLWWPKTRGQLPNRLTVKRGASLKRRLHDLHNVFGVYSLPLLLVVVLTGTTFEFEKPIRNALFGMTGTRAEPEPPKVKPSSDRHSIDELLRTAEARVPGRTSFVFLPGRPGQTFRVLRDLPGTMRRRARVAVDPGNGEVVHVDGEAPPTGRFVADTFAPLHFGTWGGVASRAAYLLLGLVPLGLFVTGIWKWVLRRRGKPAATRVAT
ncbi:MAG: PepSY-associated TM helix domain-containing protein [Fimbriimonas sp.]